MTEKRTFQEAVGLSPPDHAEPRVIMVPEAEVDRLTAEIARLKAELEERSGRIDALTREADSWRHDYAGLERERDEARAAAGAMREALEDLIGVFGSRIKFDRDQEPMLAAKVDRARSALSPTIGAEVMRVVRAARPVAREFANGHPLIVDLRNALAALGGTHER